MPPSSATKARVTYGDKISFMAASERSSISVSEEPEMSRRIAFHRKCYFAVSFNLFHLHGSTNAYDNKGRSDLAVGAITATCNANSDRGFRPPNLSFS